MRACLLALALALASCASDPTTPPTTPTVCLDTVPGAPVIGPEGERPSSCPR